MSGAGEKYKGEIGTDGKADWINNRLKGYGAAIRVNKGLHPKQIDTDKYGPLLYAAGDDGYDYFWLKDPVGRAKFLTDYAKFDPFSYE